MFGVSKGAKEESVCGLSYSVVAFVSLSLSGPTHEVIMIHTHTTLFSPPLVLFLITGRRRRILNAARVKYGEGLFDMHWQARGRRRMRGG